MLHRLVIPFKSEEKSGILHKALCWAANLETCCFLNSNGFEDLHSKSESIIAAGVKNMGNIRGSKAHSNHGLTEDFPSLERNKEIIARANSIENNKDVISWANSPERNKEIIARADGIENNKEVISWANSLDKLREFQALADGPIFGFLSYNLKDELEEFGPLKPFDDEYKANRARKKSSPRPAEALQFPHLYFFQPEYLIRFNAASYSIESDKSIAELQRMADRIAEKSLDSKEHAMNEDPRNLSKLRSRESKASYLEKIQTLQKHIKRGDVYELNFCQEFYAEQTIIDPVSTYMKLNELSPAPFSTFFKHKDLYIISSSPERFLKRDGNKVLSQPIKGTFRRSKQAAEDQLFANSLEDNAKERAENTMIVDLVRNDLSRVAEVGSVVVIEFCKVHTFAHVHQLISSISAKVSSHTNTADMLNALFPMGSMTGAPKRRAMELIEEHESVARSAYSGSIGYIEKNGDFDFNVLIRTILYDAQHAYLSLSTGSAITALSRAEEEYNECLLKANALIQALGITD